MKSVRSKLFVLIMGTAFGLGVILFVATMIQMTAQQKAISDLGESQMQETTAETTDTLQVLEVDVTGDFSNASSKYFNEIFTNVRNHAEAIASRASALYMEGEVVCEPDEYRGIIKGVDPDSVTEEFGIIAPIRDFIAYLPDYDVKHLEVLDLYIVTESGMCLDGTFDPLGDEYADLRNEDWYKQVKQSKSIYWSGIFTGKVTGRVKVVCAMPIFGKGGKFMGCAVSDIAVETFQNLLEDFDERQIESVVFFDSNQNLMYATNEYARTDDVQKLLLSGSDFARRDGELISFRKMEETGWTIAIIMSEDTILKAINDVQSNIKENSETTNGYIVRSIKYSVWNFLIVVIIGVVATAIITFFASRRFVKPINELMQQVAKVGEGNLDTVIDVRTNDEVGKLATAFNQMTVDLKDYMLNLEQTTKEKERIGAELNVATQIQADMLPNIFPAFPDNPELDLYATMTPAKEVGGDFYDFFRIDEDHIGLVMADVSGKGVPAALFMVIAKTLIKNHAMQGLTPMEILRRTNEQLCEGNKSELFVTVWIAIINIKSGEGVASNAGHEHPALMRAGSDFELVKYKHSVAVAIMDGVMFREHEFHMNPGDMVFVYTDGVTEATDASNELFGDERLVASLNAHRDLAPRELLDAVRADIDAFVGDAPQFDDLTMMAFRYL